MSLVSEEKQNELIKKWTPIVFFHPDEKYYPVSIDWLMKYSSLIDFETTPPQVVKPVTNQILYDYAKKYNFQRKADGDLILSYGPELYRGEFPISNVPIYVLYREVGDKIYLTYILLFAYNGEYPILNLMMAGYHPADIEHLTVELDKSGNLLRAMFSAHGTQDGRWVSKDEISMEKDRIVVYSSLSGHGLYNKEGIIFRLGGMANDHTSRDGLKWIPTPSRIYLRDDPKFEVATMGWTTFHGRLGGPMLKGNTDGITGLPDKRWYNEIDNLDPNFYKPPTILSPAVGGALVTIKDIFLFGAIYFVIYVVLNMVHKNLYKNKDTNYTFKSHVTTIVITLVTFAIFKTIIKNLLIKYIPS